MSKYAISHTTYGWGRVRLHASPHPGISDGAEGTLRGSPAQILFIWGFRNGICVVE
jgi:hypothetical protein